MRFTSSRRREETGEVRGENKRKQKSRRSKMQLPLQSTGGGGGGSGGGGGVGNGGPRMMILGTGFVGRHLALQLLQRRWHVSGSCSSTWELNQLRSLRIGTGTGTGTGIHPDDAHLFHAQRHQLSDLQCSLQLATHLLVSVPPISPLGDPLLSLPKHKHDLHRFLCHPNANLQWLAYLSSTSVYGDCGGASVDEDYPVNPLTQSAKFRFQAETAWAHFGRSLGLPTFIFRLGGIYGPGRSALDTLMKGRELSENQKRRDSRDFYHTARIHVTDICQAILSSIENPSMPMGRIYNVVDDDPAPRAEVFAFAWDLICQRYPEVANELKYVNLGDGQRFIGEKRVSNMRMKKELGVELMYPSYKSGLQSILDSWSSNI